MHGLPSLRNIVEDTVTVAIGLTATDDNGSTTLSATLVVSSAPEPTLAIPLSQQSLSSNSLSAPSTVLYHPSTPFTIKFDPDTFTDGDNTKLSYYAVSSNNTPLPTWIMFDENTLTFTGQTPDYQSIILPPQTFGVQLIASDVQAFAGTSLFFNFEVGVHFLAFENTEIVINATAGQELRHGSLLGSLRLDGSPVTRSSISFISSSAPSWLTIDNTPLALSGTVPSNCMFTLLFLCFTTSGTTGCFGSV